MINRTVVSVTNIMIVFIVTPEMKTFDTIEGCLDWRASTIQTCTCTDLVLVCTERYRLQTDSFPVLGIFLEELIGHLEKHHGKKV